MEEIASQQAGFRHPNLKIIHFKFLKIHTFAQLSNSYLGTIYLILYLYTLIKSTKFRKTLLSFFYLKTIFFSINCKNIILCKF